MKTLEWQDFSDTHAVSNWDGNELQILFSGSWSFILNGGSINSFTTEVNSMEVAKDYIEKKINKMLAAEQQ